MIARHLSRQRRKLRASSGFTLLEVLVALTVFAVGASIMMSLISGSLGNIRKSGLSANGINTRNARPDSAKSGMSGVWCAIRLTQGQALNYRPEFPFGLLVWVLGFWCGTGALAGHSLAWYHSVFRPARAPVQHRAEILTE